MSSERTFDKTQLHANQHGYLVHRDYAAHFFRWGWATRFINKQTTVLDVGCGQDVPLMKVLTAMGKQPKYYLGVDLNKMREVPTRTWGEVWPEFNFIRDHKKCLAKEGNYLKMPGFDIITNFEVIEHMTKPMGSKLLKAFKHCLLPEGRVILSTPCFNGSAAKNHIHEYTIEELAKSIDKAGLEVDARYGTFASWNDIKKVLPKDQKKLYEDLHQFYSHDVLACFLAPLYPDYSRNNVWLLKHKEK